MRGVVARGIPDVRRSGTVVLQMADLTPQQRANLEATVASQQRIAMAIVAMPRDRRAAGIAEARRIFEDTVKEYGIDSEAGRTWVASMVQGIEILVAEIEASGGDGGGTA
jgi:hypothetical protein